MSQRYVWVNGDLQPEQEARISVFDHGLLYGDGVYDTMFARYGFIFKLEEHLDRFLRSLQAVALEIPLSREDLRHAVLDTVARNDLTDAYIKVVATRGVSPEPLLDPRGCTPTVIVFARGYVSMADPAKATTGLAAKIVSMRRINSDALDARLKSLNYLNFVLAKIEALNADCDEALLLDDRGLVCEAPGYNVFVAKGMRLITPRRSVLEGITRGTVLEIGVEMGLECLEESIRPFDIYTADEAFLTSTAAGVVPIASVDGRRVGAGRPGPVFARISAAYDDLLRSGARGTRIPFRAATFADQ